jgi:DNA-binding IclR family transcriptional regulator
VANASGETVQTIAKATALLKLLEHAPDGLSLGQLAEGLSMPRSTVQRLVDALKAEALVVRASPRGGVKLGPLLLRLALSAESPSAQQIRPIIVDLSRRLRETVDVSTQSGGAAIFVDQVPGRQRLVALSAVGERFPLISTAPGKALLALLDRSAAEHLLARSLRDFPAWPLRDPAAFWRDIDACRTRGYAFDEEEHSAGISAVGAAFHDPVGLPLMISVPSPAERFQRNRDRFVGELLRASSEARIVLQRFAAR